MVQEMYKDFDALNVLRPDFEPRATHHIPEIIEIVEKLIKRGHAYVADNGDVMFDVESFKEYGKLSRQDLEQLQAGARIEINEIKKIQWISCFGKCRKKTSQVGLPLGAQVVLAGILNVRL